IKMLALTPGHGIHREQLMDQLWPQLEPDSAANNLHKALYMARRALEPGLTPKQPSSYVHLQGDLVRLRAPGTLWIDAEMFRNAAMRAKTSRDPGVYEEALQLYRGDLLPEDRYEDWAEAPRESLKSLYFELLLDLSFVWEERGE